MKIACVLLPNFEVAVELNRRPELAGRPVVVGGLPHERKRVRSCSPEAASFGVTAGMPLRQASGLCPEATFLPADERLYRDVFDTVLEVLDAFSPKVEIGGDRLSAVSRQRTANSEWQEANRTQNPEPKTQNYPLTHHASFVAYLDASGLELLFGPDEELGQRIAVLVETRVGLHPRVGIGGGKFVAHMAAMAAMPGATVVVKPGEERRFLAPLPVEWIPSSDEMRRRMNLFGLRSMGQLAGLPDGTLGEQFGPEGLKASRLTRGIDERPVVARAVPTVLQEEMEVDPPTESSELLVAVATRLIDRLEARMRSSYLACQEVALELGFEDASAARLSTTLHETTDSGRDLQRAVERLLGRVWARVADGDQPSAISNQLTANSEWQVANRAKSSVESREDSAFSTQHSALPAPAYSVLGPQASVLVSLLRVSLSGFGKHHGEQMELFGSRAAGLRKVSRTVQQAEELFGDGSIVPLADVAGDGPPARSIKVVSEVDGQPLALFVGGRREVVREVSNRWRVQRNWWRRERMREYYRVITESGRLCLIFQDLLHGGWFLERIYE